MAFLAAAAVVFVSLDIVDAAFGIILAALALYVAAVDLERFEIPDVVNIAIFVFGLIWTVTIFGTHVDVLLAAAVRAVAAAGLLLAVRAVYGIIRGVEGLGLGDVKLAGAAAAWLYWSYLLTALTIAVIAALLLVFGRSLIARERLQAHLAIPLGTFFAPAIWLAWYAQAYDLLSAASFQ